MKKAIQCVKDLKIYNLSYSLAMEVFEISREYPREETYSLTDQVRRSSRSIAINIREGYAKKKYEQIFIRHLNDALGSCEETRGWLDFSRDCKYIVEDKHSELDAKYKELSAMLYSLMVNWKNFKNNS